MKREIMIVNEKFKRKIQNFDVDRFKGFIHHDPIYFIIHFFFFNISALKIHVSPKTKEILDKFGTFELCCRGEVTLKVKKKKKYMKIYFNIVIFIDKKNISHPTLFVE